MNIKLTNANLVFQKDVTNITKFYTEEVTVSTGTRLSIRKQLSAVGAPAKFLIKLSVVSGSAPAKYAVYAQYSASEQTKLTDVPYGELSGELNFTDHTWFMLFNDGVETGSVFNLELYKVEE